MRSLFTTTVLSCALLSGCATMVEGANDKISLSTNPPSYANCSLKNEQGSWNVNVPAVISVKKSRSPLNIVCVDQTTGAKGSSTVQSEVEPWDFGNAATAGLGMGVDWQTGAAFNYPPEVAVTLVTNMPNQAPAPGSAGYFAPTPEIVTPPITAPVAIAPAVSGRPVSMPAPMPGAAPAPAPVAQPAPMTYAPPLTVTPAEPAQPALPGRTYY